MEATIIYPHQLFTEHPAIQKGRVIFMVEEPLFLREFPVHTQKLLLHRLSMQAYAKMLEEQGYAVVYLAIQSLTDTASVFKYIQEQGVQHLHIVDTTDAWLEARILAATKEYGFGVSRYESPLFLLSKSEAVERYKKSKRHMARFYTSLRKDKKILVTDEGTPVGEAWSFDHDNRKKIPRGTVLPDDITSLSDAAISEAQVWLQSVPGEHYGTDTVWVPWTHKAAKAHLQRFLEERLQFFGTYEDAIVADHTRLFHSTLSPLLNIGLLIPQEVLDAAITFGAAKGIAINNIEGFVRQILGWREFVRASYEAEGSAMRSQNFWNHTRKLPAEFWRGTTGLPPIDAAITRALAYGYNHHIERLMVLGNFMLLSRTHPHEVYRWFMAMYVDAYDWVMVPNVYGMSQFADGGSFATKPYISGSNYICKMSDYAAGSWEETWTALYWHFIATHRDFFVSNHRLSMMPRILDQMDDGKREGYRRIAAQYLQGID